MTNIFKFYKNECFRSNESIIYQTMDASWIKPDPDIETTQAPGFFHKIKIHLDNLLFRNVPATEDKD